MPASNDAIDYASSLPAHDLYALGYDLETRLDILEGLAVAAGEDPAGEEVGVGFLAAAVELTLLLVDTLMWPGDEVALNSVAPAEKAFQSFLTPGLALEEELLAPFALTSRTGTTRAYENKTRDLILTVAKDAAAGTPLLPLPETFAAALAAWQEALAGMTLALFSPPGGGSSVADVECLAIDLKTGWTPAGTLTPRDSKLLKDLQSLASERLISSLVGNDDEAQEAVADAIEKVGEHLPNLPLEELLAHIESVVQLGAERPDTHCSCLRSWQQLVVGSFMQAAYEVAATAGDLDISPDLQDVWLPAIEFWRVALADCRKAAAKMG